MLKNFFLKLVILSVIQALVIYLMSQHGYFVGYQSFVWISLAFLILVTVGAYVLMLRALAMKGHTNFMIVFGAAFGIKSLASLIFISYFIFFKPIVNKNFILPFFVMYFLYTGLLVSHIWRMTERKPLP